jgi:hypothetical protein
LSHLKKLVSMLPQILMREFRGFKRRQSNNILTPVSGYSQM